jgi:general secretion pathway protein N
MIRGKRIAILQGAVAGVLAIAAVMQGAGLGTGYSLEEDDASRASTKPPAAIAGEPNKVKPWPQYVEILNRPLFNESREPEEVAAPAAAPNENAAGELNAVLAGVIITRDARVAIITNAANGEAQRVRLGQPLEGDLAGWSLVELNPRIAVFEGSGAGRKELELMVDTKGATAPAAPPRAAPQPATPGNPQPAPPQPAGTPPQPTPAGAAPVVGQPATADEIRRRIEERRKQLREEAQRMLQEQEQNPTQ